jgi:hypothetical protein
VKVALTCVAAFKHSIKKKKAEGLSFIELTI